MDAAGRTWMLVDVAADLQTATGHLYSNWSLKRPLHNGLKTVCRAIFSRRPAQVYDQSAGPSICKSTHCCFSAGSGAATKLASSACRSLLAPGALGSCAAAAEAAPRLKCCANGDRSLH